MIIGPYEEPFLEAAIDSVACLCDEFILVDTSPDNQPNKEALARLWLKYNFAAPKLKIINMPRGEDKDFSFSEARELARTNTESEWVLRLDADEVIHENDIDKLRMLTKDDRFNNIEVAFYHFMMYPWLYQYIEPKAILMRTNSFSWINGVHEVPKLTGRTQKVHDIKYFHYGYCRGQEEVFKRWQLYVEIDGRPTWYNGVNPSTILSDRISVCQNFKGEHPLVVQDVLAKMFSGITPFQIREIPRYRVSDRHAGLLLLVYNDKENLEKMLPSLASSIDYPTTLYIIDLGSTDGSVELLLDWQQNVYLNNQFFSDIVIKRWKHLEALTRSMNTGFTHLMSRQECDFIGWIHPDMIFEPAWLSELVATLDSNPYIGKACSYNIRDSWPASEELMDGQEQAFLIKRGVLFKIGLFDEAFIGIGGYEDWDMNNRIRQEGFRVVIAPRSKVWHKGMATRERRDTTSEQIYNAEIYRKKWKTNKEDAV
jgi:glycosyltransferase involved in cell wall biosynthesis